MEGAIAGAITGSVAGPISQSLISLIGQYLGYCCFSTHNVDTMLEKMKDLCDARTEVESRKDTNERMSRKIPDLVPQWLLDVTTIEGESDSISRIDTGCFNLITRFVAGKRAWETTEAIERLLTRNSKITWTDAQIPLARVSPRSERASTSNQSSGHIRYDFKSRDTIFKDALMFLKDHKTQVIALFGMGGVGKTTMMEQLKKFAEDTKMFDWIVRVDIGKQPKPFSIQHVVSKMLGHPLTETVEEIRAESLRKFFEKNLEKDKKGILVILDDVWGKVELKDVGLSPLPNGVKLLLIARYEDICRSFAVEAGHLHLEVLKVDVLEETEARKLLCQITGVSKEHDPVLYQIGGEIVKRCSYLPLAINLIASTLKSLKPEREAAIWRAIRDRLPHYLQKGDPDQNVHEIINTSYHYLKDEEAKEIFLLCGLFPEDSDIPIEDLTRYAWGLQLLNGVSTLEDARDRTEACVSHLKNAHLLIDNDDPRYVKLHDLVLDFVLATVSKDDRAWLIKHGDVSTRSPIKMSKSYKRISLSCKGLHEFPESFKSPNLSLLKLMDGDDSFWFPEDFYGNTEKLEVIAYERMWSPLLLPRLLQCSTNLRTLCLHQCSLMFDCSFIGNLVNLEVLSFFASFLRELPSSVGNLKKLKLLDLTGCSILKINDGVLKNLVKLEELYMRDIEFTERNSNELAGRSKNLLALEIKCFENKGQLKNMSYENLKRFKIFMGHDRRFDGMKLSGDMMYPVPNGDRRFDEMKLFGNRLYLAINKNELLESRLNGLLVKTEVLFLQVDGMRNVEDIEVKSLRSLHYSSFSNLRFLKVSECPELRYIFTLGVATTLSKLERLHISSCESMQELIHIESSESETITFPKLKFLSLDELPNLSSLCNTIIEIKLPQLMDLQLDGLPKCTSIYPKKNLATSSMAINDSAWRPFLNEEVMVPKLEKLRIRNMENLKEIWACQYSSSNEADVCILREIDVKGCDSLVNLFPSNPMTLMQHLEDLKVENCGSIEALFNIDLGCVGKFEEVSCCLRNIQVRNLGKLREVWRIKGANNMTDLHISAFQAVESIRIKRCPMLRNVLTPTNANFDMSSLTNIIISDSGESRRNNELLKSSQQQEIDVISNEEVSEVGDIISSVVFPSYLIHTFHHVQTLCIFDGWKRAETVFEIDSSSSRELATNHATQRLPLLPYLEDITLVGMDCMSHVWKCNWNEFLITQKQQPKLSFDNLTTINMFRCRSIKYLFSPLMAELLCNLEKVNIGHCIVIEEVVSNKDDEVEERTTNTSTNLFARLDILTLENLPKLKRIGGGGTKCGSNEISFSTTIPIHDQFQFPQEVITSWSLCQYSRGIDLKWCHALSSAIPFNAIGQMQKLEKLRVWHCDSLVEVFETQRNFDEGSDTALAISRLKNINVPQLSKYSLDSPGLNFPQIIPSKELLQVQKLERIHVEGCDSVKEVFEAREDSSLSDLPYVVKIPKLRVVELCDLYGLKYIWKSNPWMVLEFPNLTKLFIDGCKSLEHVFSSSMVGSLLQLQELFIMKCGSMEVIVEEENVVVQEGDDAKVNNEIIMLPRLKSLQLEDLQSLEGFYLGKEAFSWPSLETLKIKGCPAIRVFTKGHSATPQLKVIDTSFRRCELQVDGEDQLNSFINTIQQEGLFGLPGDGDGDGDGDEDEDEDEDD